MRFAYADPPYIGCSRYYRAEAEARGRVASEVDHRELIARLVAEYPDGWALSCSSPSLVQLLPLCPEKTRVLAWVKTWAAARPGITPRYAWEPVIFAGGRRRRSPGVSPVLDWHMGVRVDMAPNVTNTAKGAKPLSFCWWLLACLGFQPGDELDDLFPGTGTMTEAVAIYVSQMALPLDPVG